MIYLLFQNVESDSPAHEAGLRPGDLIMQVNGEAIQGLLHVQVVALIMAGGSKVSLKAAPLDKTPIKLGGRKRTHHMGKMFRQRSRRRNRRGKTEEKRRASSSLFKKLSSKRAEQHLASPLTPSKSFGQLNRSLSSSDSLPGSPTRLHSPKSPPGGRLWSPISDSAQNSSQSSSTSSSAPNSPASVAHLNPRPSSLHGLKHKLQTNKSPHRRKSIHNMPLSPLARTPSPSPMATSPTRSPSPLTMVHGHGPVLQPHGISNMTQIYNPLQQQSSPGHMQGLAQTLQGSTCRKHCMRPKSVCDPSPPLLRRALSPERLHPSSAEKPRSAEKHKAEKQTSPRLGGQRKS